MTLPDLTNPALIDEYAAWLELCDFAPRTVRQRSAFATRLLGEFGTLSLSHEQTVQWLRGHEGWTRITYRNHLSSLFTWLVETDRAEENHASKVRRAPSPRPRPNPLTEDEVAAVLAASSGRCRAWVMLALYAGLRLHEIAKFRGQEINERSITLVGKGGQGAMIPTHPDLWVLAQEYPSRGWWFPSDDGEDHVTIPTVQNAIYRLYRPLGITGNIHRLRATYGTRLARGGAHIRVVQELLRHRSLQSTEHYIAAAADELGAAIRGLPPAA